MILQAVSLLEGKYDQVLREINDEMEKAAEELRFEKAASLRDRRNAISQLGQRQKVVGGMTSDTDVVGFYDGAKKAVAVLHFIDGMLLDKDVEIIDSSVEGSAEEIIDAYVTQYYAGRSGLPRFILLPADIESRESLARMLTESAERKVEISAPQRGKKLELISLAEKNAREEAERLTTRNDRSERNLKLLAKSLGLEEPPQRIEAYDISNLSGSDIVASMTVFEGGMPLKKDYRRFKIESTEGQDDYGSMREVLSRRFKRYLENDAKFASAPDLLLIDGGEVHAKTAADTVGAAGLQIPVFGMVKDGRHRTRALVAPDGREIGISAVPQLFAFIGRIQEETHRFAIEYNRTLRKKRIVGSELDKIEGVGPARRKALLRRFKGIKNIRSASPEELNEVVPHATAEAIRKYFEEAENNPQ
jgi:excinuclease ABC subunit C